MKKENFRQLKTSSGKIVLLGKNAKNNEQLVKQIKPDEEVFHTAQPGSPFVNLKGSATKKDIKESALFCARYSQDWRDNKKNVEVHRFKGRDIYKKKDMKLGCFGVKKFKLIKIKKQDIVKFEENGLIQKNT
jgi:predicted ribosome quality control (RQC) complex YloA/Tae2 family protein